MPDQSDWLPDSSLTQHIELTVCTLQDPVRPLIDQPRLTQRYLARPPFRFIHDIVTSVQQATGFAPGLYQGSELDARTIQGRDAKVAFLFKIMSVVSIVLHSPMPADPFKVVAGLEPENTNTFLQMLGKASTLRGDASDIVQAVLVLEQNTQDAALSELQHSKQQGESEGGEDSEAPGTSSSREDEQANSQEAKGMSQRLAGLFSRLQGQFKQRFNKQDRTASDSPRSRDGAAMQEETLRSPGPSRSRASMQAAPSDVEAEEPVGCLPGFQFSQQMMRKLSRSTSASLVVFKRNGSVVHPFPGKQAPSAQ